MKNKKIIIVLLSLVLLLVAVIVAMLFVVKKQNKDELTETIPTLSELQPADETAGVPWKVAGAKQPKDYTWDEYYALTPELQILFYNSFAAEDFDAWLEENEPREAAVEIPWEVAGAKQPKDYTLEEYSNLTNDQQAVFYNWFESEAAFEAWRQQKTKAEAAAKAPWEEAGSKQPQDYTWDEYLALSVQNQSLFFNSFGGAEAFTAWMERVKSASEQQEDNNVQPTELPLNSTYTWDEYTALTEQAQTAFFNTFENEAAFNTWMDSVRPSDAAAYPWEIAGSKQPEAYTWEDYNNLSADQQVVFFNYLNSQGKFDAWLVENEPG